MSFEKFKILVWKNWMIQKRNWKSGLVEIIIPIALIILVTWVQSLINSDVADILQDLLTTFAKIWLPLVIVFCMFFTVNSTIKVSVKKE